MAAVLSGRAKVWSMQQVPGPNLSTSKFQLKVLQELGKIFFHNRRIASESELTIVGKMDPPFDQIRQLCRLIGPTSLIEEKRELKLEDYHLLPQPFFTCSSFSPGRTTAGFL